MAMPTDGQEKMIASSTIKVGAPAKMKPAGTSANNDSKVNDAIRYLMDDNTKYFKDFHFPSNMQIVLYNCMQQNMTFRLRAMKANRMQGDVMTIVKAYRTHHSKADDQKYIMSAFTDMQLLVLKLERIKKIQDRQEASAKANKSVVLPTQRGKKETKKRTSRCFVRYNKAEDTCEYVVEHDDDTDEE